MPVELTRLALAEVSMKSGLEDRNNPGVWWARRVGGVVSMKSGLEDRNNVGEWPHHSPTTPLCLNEVRPGRPEQSGWRGPHGRLG